MSYDPQAIIDALVSHAQGLGVFEKVNGHEPISPPGFGLSAAVWADSLGPAPRGSGLSSSTGLMVVFIRLYSSALSEPADAIDPNMLSALHQLFGAVSADFTLGDLVLPGLDLLGQAGVTMRADAGYLPQGDITFRVYTLRVPILINDMWTQAP